MKIAIIGGGISGLTAAFAARRAGHQVTCFAEHPGGVIGSQRQDGFLCETGPQALLDGAEVRGLIDDLGLAGRVLPAARVARKRFIYVDGKLRGLAPHPVALLLSNALSLKGKWRALRETAVPPRAPGAGSDSDDESVYDFARRRLGDEAARRLVAPAVIGIFAGDAARLSLRSAFPKLAAMEAEHGSLLRALRTSRGGARGGIISFPDGLAELVDALAASLGGDLIRTRVHGIAHDGAHWRVSDSDQAFDALVVSTPPAETVRLLAPLLPGAARTIAAIPRASVGVVALGFRRPGVGMDLNGYGFLVARGERPTILGCQFESTVFPGRAPDGQVLLRVLVGGTFNPAALELDDAALVARAVDDLRVAAGLTADPDFSAVWRHRSVLPQYELGHEQRARSVESAVAALPGLKVLGVALRGVGLADCVRNATAWAARLPAP